MLRWLKRLPGTRRFGRRALILLHGGAAWIMTGWAIYTVPLERFSRPGPGGTMEIMDTPYPGIMWVIGGVLAVGNALLRGRLRGRDVIGFLGLITPPAVWLALFIWSASLYRITHGQSGNPRAITGVIVWYLITAWVMIDAGWRDPEDPSIHPAPPRRRRG